MTGHAPRKDAVVHLHNWLVHCSASVKAPQPAAIQNTVSLVQETEHDMDTDSDTSSDNSGRAMSDSDTC